MDSKTTYLCRWLVTNQHSSTDFMPALCVRPTVLHEWARRGYLNFPAVGKGRLLWLFGTELLLARALVILSRGGVAPGKAMHSLRRIINDFADEVDESCEDSNTVPQRFACLCYTIRAGEAPEPEWGLYDQEGLNNLTGGKSHIMLEANGLKRQPYYLVLDLTSILIDVALKVWKEVEKQ